MTKRITNNNPYKANQWVPDPRQIIFLQNFLDPKSKTFSNVYQSGLAAGFKDNYARNLTAQMPTWLKERLDELKMINKAERNLNEFLEMDTTNKGTTKDGKEIYEFDDVGKIRIKADISKFVAERLNKNRWSERKEHTGDKGDPIGIVALIASLDIKEADKAKEIEAEEIELKEIEAREIKEEQ